MYFKYGLFPSLALSCVASVKKFYAMVLDTYFDRCFHAPDLWAERTTGGKIYSNLDDREDGRTRLAKRQDRSSDILVD